MLSIFKDIKSGALPVREIPDFLAWYFGSVAWMAILLAVLCTVALLILTR